MRRLWRLAISGLLILMLAAPAFAAPLKKDEEKEASWVISYALVLLGTGLGVAGVCRAARRSKKIPDVD